MDLLIRGADVLAEVVWQAGRGDAQQVLDGLAATLSQAGGLATTFLGPLALLFGMVGLLVTTVVLFMRSSLLYLVAAFAPIVWSSSVSPVMRGAGRRLVHVAVALVAGQAGDLGDVGGRREAARQRRHHGTAGELGWGGGVGDAGVGVRVLRHRRVVAVGGVPAAALGGGRGGVVGDRRRMGAGGDDRGAGRADGQVARRQRSCVGGHPQPPVTVRHGSTGTTAAAGTGSVAWTGWRIGARRRRQAIVGSRYRTVRRVAAVAGRRRRRPSVPSEAGQVPLPSEGDEDEEVPS